MKCPRCEEQVQEDFAFCTQCGAALSKGLSDASKGSSDKNQDDDRVTESAEPLSRSSWIPVALIAVLVVGAMAFGAFWLLAPADIGPADATPRPILQETPTPEPDPGPPAETRYEPVPEWVLGEYTLGSAEGVDCESTSPPAVGLLVQPWEEALSLQFFDEDRIPVGEIIHPNITQAQDDEQAEEAFGALGDLGPPDAPGWEDAGSAFAFLFRRTGDAMGVSGVIHDGETCRAVFEGTKTAG